MKTDWKNKSIKELITPFLIWQTEAMQQEAQGKGKVFNLEDKRHNNTLKKITGKLYFIAKIIGERPFEDIHPEHGAKVYFHTLKNIHNPTEKDYEVARRNVDYFAAMFKAAEVPDEENPIIQFKISMGWSVRGTRDGGKRPGQYTKKKGTTRKAVPKEKPEKARAVLLFPERNPEIAQTKGTTFQSPPITPAEEPVKAKVKVTKTTTIIHCREEEERCGQ